MKAIYIAGICFVISLCCLPLIHWIRDKLDRKTEKLITWIFKKCLT